MACVKKRPLRGKHTSHVEVWTLDFRDKSGRRRIMQTKWSEDKDKVKAEKLLATYQAQVEAGEFEAKNSRRTFNELREAYLAQFVGRREFTVKDYISMLIGSPGAKEPSHIERYFGQMRLRSINKLAVEQFRTYLVKRGLSVGTVNKLLHALSRLFKYAQSHSPPWMGVNPCDGLRLRRKKADKRRLVAASLLTQTECERLIAAAGWQRDRVLFRFAVETGARQGEILGLRWEDISWHSSHVHIQHTCRGRRENDVKTDESNRFINLSPPMVSELRTWRLACPKAPCEAKVHDLVFPNRSGGIECPHNLVQRHFRPALRRAGLRTIRFHGLRHTCASLLFAAGVQIHEVQAHMGHENASTTLDTYGHLLPDGGTAAAQAMARIFGGGSALPPRPTGGNGVVAERHTSSPALRLVVVGDIAPEASGTVLEAP
jgi:integrase